MFFFYLMYVLKLKGHSLCSVCWWKHNAYAMLIYPIALEMCILYIFVCIMYVYDSSYTLLHHALLKKFPWISHSMDLHSWCQLIFYSLHESM